MRVRIKAAAASALAAIAITAVCASPAQATPAFSLRIEAPGATLDPGTFYAVPRSVLALRGKLSENDTGTCVPSTGRHEIDGRTALGLVAEAAQARPSLRPLLVAEDSFGRRLCRVAEAIERDAPSFSGWLFRHDHVAPPLSAELVPINRVSEVLWVFADFGTGANTGDELVLSAPARALPGAVTVTVQSISFDGAVAPAPNGTVISGGSAAATTVGGVATVPVAPGETELRAVGPGAAPTEIPSAPLSLCVSAQLDDCPEERGRQIIGTKGKDRLKGTPGPDRIRSRGGNDKVKVSGGGADFVHCGKGKDVVVADESDKVKRCDRVRGPAGKGGGKGEKKRGGKRR